MSLAKNVPTLDDVAKLSGVSTATVSRCLNDPERVVEKTRKRVMAAVQSLGYTPNFAARVMAAKRTFTIGAIIPTMDNAIFARGLQAFQEELHRKGYTLLVASSAYSPQIEEEQIRALVARGADGLLLIGHDRDPKVYDYLEVQNIPTLCAWSYLPDARLPSVGFDNHGAMQALTHAILEHGHKKLAMISAVTKGNDRAKLRVEGVKQALSERGLDPDNLIVVETTYEIESGARAFEKIIADGHRPTAVLCGNDVIAFGALHAAVKMGFDVPGDISITGFDDMDLARFVEPALTSVHVPHHTMGRKAAQELVAMLESKSKGVGTCLETHIVLRQSLGPAKT
ncbi:MAG: LacI family DNA-binding transcriptional regulator [Planktotalea sp.]|uniref:LacI family DNA-binding transcriptional regulator n=1 Tax=Planktotalea sp. TaxID=2029877 RepID=UPI003C743B27